VSRSRGTGAQHAREISADLRWHVRCLPAGMRHLLVALTLVALASGESSAADLGIYESKPTALFVQVGLGTPLGEIGLEAARTLASHPLLHGLRAWLRVLIGGV